MECLESFVKNNTACQSDKEGHSVELTQQFEGIRSPNAPEERKHSNTVNEQHELYYITFSHNKRSR